MTLHLHIDRLVLDGLGPLDAGAVQAAAEAELARLFAASGVPSGLAHDPRRPRVDGGAFCVETARLGVGAEGVGTHIARRIHSSLTTP
ncbi:hypothetical protein [Rubrivirga marina]|uniref:Uncharacterized protein n=1 Tax=Rubrivirga marina TaxID=1196024 RepID=A0A271IYY6_9BACT|nr:hypothetical protein [Rubrivirga marina]PAP76024.1 hypothetical protein BSZ37_05990 [Rubrivirga marina]